MTLSQLGRAAATILRPIGGGPKLALVLVVVAAVGLAAEPSAASAFNYLDTPVDVSPAAGGWQTVDGAANGVPAGATGVILQVINTSGAADYQYAVCKQGFTDTWMLSTDAAIRGSHKFYMIGVDASRQFKVNAENAAVQTWLIGYTMTGVTFFDTGIDVSLGSKNSWEPIDITAHTQGSDVAIGAIFILKSTTNKDYGLQMAGSNDNRLSKIEKGCMGAWIGVDANEICEMRIADTKIDALLVGYVTEGAVFFQDAVNKSTGTSGSYQPVDITANLVNSEDVPNGALLELYSTNDAQYSTAVRPNGSGFDKYYLTRTASAISGVDGDDILQQKVSSTNMDLYVVGYTLLDVNHRSIGTAAGALYSTGNASINVASRTVTFGGGASLPTNVGQGDQLSMGGDVFFVLSRDSATQVTIDDYSTNTHTNVTFTLKRAYNTILAWETGRDGDLVANGWREVGVCYNDGPFVMTSRLQINGSTTDALHYMKLTVADGHRHDGTANTGVVIDCNGGFSSDAIIIQDPYTVVEWLEVTNIQDNFDAVEFTTDCTGSVCSNMLVHDVGHYAFSISVAPGGVTVRNCISYDLGAKPALAANGSVAYIENCTFDNTGTDYGITAYNPSTIHVKNTISVGAGLYDINVNAGTVGSFGYNMYSTYTGFDPSSFEGGNQLPPADLEDLFVSMVAGSEDLHLEAIGNDAVDNGLDLSASFTADIDGETRVAPWDIGADWDPTAINYRSIGTNSGTLYSTGNASITAGERIVTFAGATLPANIGQGDELVLNASETLYILTRDSDTQVTVQGVAAATHANVSYTIKRVYNTLQAWEDARDGDLVASDFIEVGVCYNDGEFTAGVTVTGSTTDADHYFKLTVAEGQRHDASAQSGARINGASYTGGDYIISLEEDYSVLEWLEIYNFNPVPSCGTGAVKTWNGREATIEYLLVHNFNSCAAAIELYRGGTIRNCLIYNGDTGIFLNMSAEGQTGIVENCTVWTSWGGVKSWPGAYPVEIRNTISVGGSSSNFDLENDTIAYFGYNMYDPAKVLNFDPGLYQGNNQAPPADLDDLFISSTPGSKDLHLEIEGHDAIGRGLDLSSSFTTDIDGQTREAPWDIGADWVQVDINYRSIGIDAGTLYSIGDATIPLGSTIVTFGFGADLPTNIGQGDELVIGAETFYILSRDSATQVTVQAPATSAHSNDSYTIKRVYNTLQAWENAVDGDLVGESRREVGVCYNDGRFTDQLVISGSTTSAAHYLRLTVAEGQRHDGIADNGAGIDGTAWGNADAVTVEDEYTRIEWLEFEAHTNSGDAVWFKNSPAADNGLVHGIFVHGYWQNSNAGVRAVAPNITIRNSFFTGGTSAAISVDTGCTMCYIENCTIIGSLTSGSGVSSGASTNVSIKNTISVNHDVGDDFVLWAGISYFGNNMFDPAQVTGFDPDAQDGGNQLPPSNIGRLFVDAEGSTPDLHLKPRGHRAGNTGLDLSASFTDDIDGVTRVDSWDIGADEAIDGTDPLPPVVITWKEVDPN